MNGGRIEERINERIDSLQVIRAMAFAGIFLYHAIRTFPGKGYIYRFMSKGPGPWGVSVFFILSGFLMTYSYRDRPPAAGPFHAARFSLRKIGRLYPLHLIMLLAGALYSYLLDGATVKGIRESLVRTIPLIQTWFPVRYQALNSVAWYLADCVFLYFCFPFLLKLLLKYGNRKRAMAGMGLVYVLQLAAAFYIQGHTALEVKWAIYCHPLFRLGDFMIGCLLVAVYTGRKAKSMQKLPEPPDGQPDRFPDGQPESLPDRQFGRQPDRWKCSVLETAALVSNIAVCAYYESAPDELKWFTYTSLFIPTSVLLVYSFALDAGLVSGLLKNRFVFWLAKISPYAFLVHRLVIYYFYSFAERVLHRTRISFFLVIMVPFVVTVAIVYLYLALKKMATRKEKAH